MKVRLTKEQKIRIANSDDVYKIMQAVLMRQNRFRRGKEYFWVLGLNTSNDIMYLELVAIGKLNVVNVDPIEIFSFASQKRCKQIILVHNHPEGKLKPSAADIKLTSHLAIGAQFLGMKILDHLIISETDYKSIGQFADVSKLLAAVGIVPKKTKETK